MKFRIILKDMVLTMASLALIGSLVIILANSLNVKGVLSVAFSFDELKPDSLFPIKEYSLSTTVGEVGILGIAISAVTIISLCLFGFFLAKGKHYGIIFSFVLIMIVIGLPFLVQDNNIVTLISYFFLILFVNPFYTLICAVPFSSINNAVYIWLGIITLLIIISTVIGYIVERLKPDLD